MLVLRVIVHESLRLWGTTLMGDSDVCPERLQALIQGLRDSFGDRALEVAQKQRDLAADDIAPTWVLIVAALQS